MSFPLAAVRPKAIVRSRLPAWVSELAALAGSTQALDIDFVNDRAWLNAAEASISSILTCTRASTGYYTNADGTLQSFSSNTLRYGTNGLLVEESRTNLLTRSQEFDHADWTKDPRVSITTDAAAALDGSTTADKLKVATTDNSFHQCYQIAKNLSNAPYCASVYVKAAELTWIILNLYDGADNRSWFNVSAGTVGTSGAGNTATIQALADGWYRCCVTRTASATANGGLSIELASADNSSTFSGTVGQGHYIWGAQLEAGTFPTSPILTTSSSAVRAADVVTRTLGAEFNASAGSVYSQQVAPPVNGTQVFWQIDDGTANERMLNWRSTATITRSVVDGGVDQVSIGTDTVAVNTSFKHAFAYAANDFACSIDGGAARTDGAGTLPTVTTLTIGRDHSANYWNSYIRRFAYWNARLGDAALATLTT